MVYRTITEFHKPQISAQQEIWLQVIGDFSKNLNVTVNTIH